MTSPADRSEPRVIGRDDELATLATVVDGVAGARAGVLVGEPGIGKTTLWASLLDHARRQGMTVLSARPAAAEAEISFAGLTDLMDGVPDEAFAGLPVPQRRALEIALLRAQPAASPPEPRAIATGLIGALRWLATSNAVLVAVDDVQWLDPATAAGLTFAARRMTQAPVRFILARRGDRPSPVERAFTPPEVIQIDLGPLSFGAVHAILGRRLGVTFTRRMTRQVFQASGGNPMLALELGRLVGEQGLEAFEELPVSDRVEELVGARVRRLSPVTRRILTAVALAPSLRRSQLDQLAGTRAVDVAIRTEAITADGDRIRPAHPLLAAAARASAPESERRALHTVLASLVADEEQRAHHLALAADEPNPELAARLSAAATHAVARGATGDAVELAGQALRLTPTDTAAWSDRLVALCEWLHMAGERDRLNRLLRGNLDRLGSGAASARAHLLLAETEFDAVHIDESDRHMEAALEASRHDPPLHALATARWSRYLTGGRVERIGEADDAAASVLPVARQAGARLERDVLFALAFARELRGSSIADLAERSAGSSPDAFHLFRSVERIVADQLASRGEIEEARRAFARLLALAEERGETWSAVWLQFQQAELELRAGNWDTAARLLDESDESPEHALMDPRAYERCRAVLAVGRGRIAEAEERATRVIAATSAQGLRWNHLEGLRARGVAALLGHDPARAVDDLATVWAHTAREGVDDPGVFPVAPDLVEGLLELGRLDAATAVTERLRALSDAQEHPWGLASATRCEALLALSRGPEDDALDRLAVAAAEYGRLGLRFDRARTLRAAGRAARRHRQWGAARGLLTQALEAFEATGSDGWAVDVRAELGRIGGRRAAPAGTLTRTEAEVARLVAQGLSSKEIAAALVISVATVETHVKHARSKLGARSRAEFAARLAQLPPG